MKSPNITPEHGLADLRTQSIMLLKTFASSTRDIARRKWKSDESKSKALGMVTAVKRDLEEHFARLEGINGKYEKLLSRGKIRYDNPDLLIIGGEYMAFIEDVTAVTDPILGDLVELVNLDEMNELQEEQVNVESKEDE